MLQRVAARFTLLFAVALLVSACNSSLRSQSPSPVVLPTATVAPTRPLGPPIWIQQAPLLTPPIRFGSRMAYDPANQTVVLFTWSNASSNPTDETWTWDGRVWVQQHPATVPPNRVDASMAYDPIQKKVILFGGYVTPEQRNLSNPDLARTLQQQTHGSAPSEQSYLNDTWIWDGITWTQLHPAASPPPRASAAMATDPATNAIVLLDGIGTNNVLLNDTWTWNGTAWQQQHPSASPPARAQPSFAYDPASRDVVLFGGLRGANGSIALNDTWTWNGATWVEQHPSASPSPRSAAVLFFDPTLRRLVLIGGYGAMPGAPRDISWTWDGKAWAQRPSFPQPKDVNVAQAIAAYDAATASDVLIGPVPCCDHRGNTPASATRLWDGRSWFDPSARPSPPARRGAALAYDPATRATVLFGGCCDQNNLLGDTLTWDGTNWTEQHPRASPPPRRYASMAYDSTTRSVVLFGGDSSIQGTWLNDTWIWNGRDWAEADPTVSPPKRAFAAMADDPSKHSIVLFGGAGFGGLLGDTWTWNGTTWVEQHPSAAPSARFGASAAYDAATHQVLLFGGSVTSTSSTTPVPRRLGDTWTWNGSTWVQQHSKFSPPARTFAAMAPFPSGTGVVLFGGSPAYVGSSLDDTWLWDGHSWTQLSVPVAPPGRDSAAMAPSADGRSIVLFGGESSGGGDVISIVSDTWHLRH